MISAPHCLTTSAPAINPRIADEASADVILFPDVTYMVEVIKMYKEEDGETYEPELNFTTSGSSSLCGISLETDGQEYLIDLSRRESTNELRAVGLCGIFKDWDDDDEDVLEAGCSSTPAPTLGAAQVGGNVANLKQNTPPRAVQDRVRTNQSWAAPFQPISPWE